MEVEGKKGRRRRTDIMVTSTKTWMTKLKKKIIINSKERRIRIRTQLPSPFYVGAEKEGRRGGGGGGRGHGRGHLRDRLHSVKERKNSMERIIEDTVPTTYLPT